MVSEADVMHHEIWYLTQVERRCGEDLVDFFPLKIGQHSRFQYIHTLLQKERWTVAELKDQRRFSV